MHGSILAQCVYTPKADQKTWDPRRRLKRPQLKDPQPKNPRPKHLRPEGGRSREVGVQEAEIQAAEVQEAEIQDIYMKRAKYQGTIILKAILLSLVHTLRG